MSKKNILLTGISGFIGRQIAAGLLENGFRIFAPVRRQSKEKIFPLSQHKNLVLPEGNFYNPKLLQTLQNEKIDAILHFASIRGAGSASQADYQKINVESTETLLQFALDNGIPNFLYCSSVGVLGTIPKQQPADSSSPVDADNIYHQTKWQAEQLVNQYAEKGLNTIILRPTITYGSGDDGFLPRLIGLIKTRYFPLTNQAVYIHLLHAEAFGNLIVHILQKNLFNNKTYIVADAKPIPFNELVEQIARETKGRHFKAPSVFFTLGRGLLNLTAMKGLHTSLQLISESWTYDIKKTIQDLGYVADNTAAVIGKYIGDYH